MSASYHVIACSDAARALAPNPYGDTAESGLFEPEDEDALVSAYWIVAQSHAKPDASALDATYIVNNGQIVAPGVQVQGQDFNYVDLTGVYVATDASDRPTGSTTLGANAAHCYVDPGGPSNPVLISGRFAATYSQPSGTSTVQWTLVDASAFSGQATNARIYANGSIYLFVSYDDSTHITVKNTAISAARVTVAAP